MKFSIIFLLMALSLQSIAEDKILRMKAKKIDMVEDSPPKEKGHKYIDCNMPTAPVVDPDLEPVVSLLPCGEKDGTINERILECSSMAGNKKEDFVLVSRTVTGQEVWQDTKSGLIWSDIVNRPGMNQQDAEKACKMKLGEMGNISTEWRLPSVGDFATVKYPGLHALRPEKRGVHFWTSHTSPGHPDVGSLHPVQDDMNDPSGAEERYYRSPAGQQDWEMMGKLPMAKDFKASVRCVAGIKK